MEDGNCEIKKKRRRIDKVDRISSLPEPLLQHIMLFLPFQQVAQTSLVSKVWRQAWLTFPVLEFNEFDERNRYQRPYQWVKRISQIRPYWEQIVQIRHRNRVGVRKFKLKTADKELADRCASYAIENNVKELQLNIWYTDQIDPSEWYNVPPIVLSSKSIDVLTLIHCKLESTRSDLKLSLRKLCLIKVRCDDQVINNIFLRCGLLEYLEVTACHGFKTIKLFGLTKLSKIIIGQNDEVKQLKIDALNANSWLCIRSNMLHELQLDICKNLTSLSLGSSSSFTDEWLCSIISRIPLLEKLSICQFYNIECMKISSCRLKDLSITICGNLVEVRLETPNLHIFRYVGDVISFSSGSDLTLSETHLCLTPKRVAFLLEPFDNIEPEWHKKYVELIAKFRQCSNVVNLQSLHLEYVHFPGELRQILTPPLSGVKHFKFKTQFIELNYAFAKVMDFLLWISPHAETICLEYPDNKFRFQFSYKQPPVYEGEIARCCKSLPVVLCWEHCIEKVDIEITNTYFEMSKATGEIRESRNLKKSVKGENILEEIDGLAVSRFYRASCQSTRDTRGRHEVLAIKQSRSSYQSNLING
ncbi:F-box domain containing protein [Melia azedarach]|uniref:F-box domain containing protein n=1 Tax=Melia azedarach TaxID=155640 RepID=A0ACC1Y726_MELAZ|nr:F-box domain containing protein [Melia azedarach]